MFCPENSPNGENFHMRSWKNEHGDIYFLFEELTVHAWNKLYAKYWKYFNVGSI